MGYKEFYLYVMPPEQKRLRRISRSINASFISFIPTPPSHINGFFQLVTPSEDDISTTSVVVTDGCSSPHWRKEPVVLSVSTWTRSP